MKKSKKKNPNPLEPIVAPTISAELLNWYTDPEAGYWSPLLTEYPKKLFDFAGVKSIADSRLIISDITAEGAEGLITSEEAEEVDELAEFQKTALGTAVAANISAEAILAATVVAAYAGLGMASDVLDEQWRLPALSAMINTAHDITVREYRSTSIPLLNRYYLRKHTPLIPDAYRLALAASKGLLVDDEYYELMAQSGFDHHMSWVWREENINWPPYEAALALLRRGDISEGTFDLWLQRSQFNPAERESLKKLRTVIPPLTDLIRFAVREAFGKHTYEEQYPAYEALAQKMGLTTEAAGWYWWSHWVRISVDRMYDNLYRGYWDDETFKRYLRLIDVHPEDREAIYRVAYHAPSIREMGYGYDVGAYTEEDIKTYRRWGGLSEEDAGKAAAALVDYRLEAEREALRREWMYLFSDEKLSEEEFRERLAAVFEMKDRTDLWVLRGELHRERTKKPAPEQEYRVVTSSEAKWAFVNGLRDEEWYRLKLSELGWDEERITVAVERAQLEVERLKPVPEEVKYRDLTVGQITDLYRFEKIPVEELSGSFEGIGYTPEDAAVLSQMLQVIRARELEPKAVTEADIVRFYDMRVLSAEELPAEYMRIGYSKDDAQKKALWAKVSIDFPDLRSMYSKGWIGADVLVAELRALGLSKERAADLAMTVVKLEAPSRIEKERDLTKSEIVKGAKAEIITPSQAVLLLMDLGYEEWEAWYILAINKVVGAGDPEGYWEMKRVTEAYKKAVGKPSKAVPDDLLVWEQRVKDLRAELARLQEEKAEEDVIAQKAIELNEAEANYRRLIQDWERLEL